MTQVATGGVTERVEQRPRDGLGWWIAGLVAIVVALHARTLGHGFYLDDYALARPWGVGEALGVFWGAFDTSGFNDAYYRPFASLSFALEWPVWGTWKVGYHLTNVTLHALAAIGVLLVLRRVHVPRWCAFAGAVFFVAVPANVTTVVYIAERTDAMVAIATTTALLLVHRYHRTREGWTIAALCVALVLGLFAKEVAVAIVPTAAVFWWYLRVQALSPATVDDTPGVVEHWRRELRLMGTALVERQGRKDWLKLLVPPIAVIVVYLVYRTAVMPPGSLGGRFAETQNPLGALTGGMRRTFEGVPWEVRSIAVVPLVVGIAGAAVLRPTSRTWRVVLLGIGLMVAGVLPLTYSGGVEPRLLYVAEIGMATVVAGVVAIYAEAITARSGVARTALAGAAIALGVVLAATTVVSMFRAQDVFAEGTVKKLDADERLWNDPVLRQYVEPEHIETIERNLIEGGRL